MPHTREARIAQERNTVGEPLLIEQSNTYPPTKCQPLDDVRRGPTLGEKEGICWQGEEKRNYMKERIAFDGLPGHGLPGQHGRSIRFDYAISVTVLRITSLMSSRQ